MRKRYKQIPEGLYKRSNIGGLTLIELLVAVVVSSLAIGGLLKIYLANQKSATYLKQVSRMQQNLKMAADFINGGLPGAGYGLAVDSMRWGFEPADTGIQVRYVDEYGHYNCAGKVVTVRFAESGGYLFQIDSSECADNHAKKIMEVDTFFVTYFNQNGDTLTSYTARRDSTKSIVYTIRQASVQDHKRELTGRVAFPNF
ncbi:MAG: hypothetical protein GF398_00135 [Chitinivibrionales bacterium]|nr:hypothetical protein [Chitinivibrionales bacterium]